MSIFEKFILMLNIFCYLLLKYFCQLFPKKLFCLMSEIIDLIIKGKENEALKIIVCNSINDLFADGFVRELYEKLIVKRK